MRDAHRELLYQMALNRWRDWSIRFLDAWSGSYAELCERIACRYTEMMERWVDHG